MVYLGLRLRKFLVTVAGSSPPASRFCIIVVMDSNIPPTWLNLGCIPSGTVFLALGSV